jgi:hypothetical protein
MEDLGRVLMTAQACDVTIRLGRVFEGVAWWPAGRRDPGRDRVRSWVSRHRRPGLACRTTLVVSW